MRVSEHERIVWLEASLMLERHLNSEKEKEAKLIDKPCACGRVNVGPPREGVRPQIDELPLKLHHILHAEIRQLLVLPKEAKEEAVRR